MNLLMQGSYHVTTFLSSFFSNKMHSKRETDESQLNQEFILITCGSGLSGGVVQSIGAVTMNKSALKVLIITTCCRDSNAMSTRPGVVMYSLWRESIYSSFIKTYYVVRKICVYIKVDK